MRMKLISVAALAAVFFVACGGSSGDAPGTAPEPTAAGSSAGSQVAIKAFEFRPGEIQVSAGDTVTWTNEDDIAHTVTSGKAQEQGVPGVTEDEDAAPDGAFDHELDGVDSTFSFTFDDAGRYPYFCAIHPGMTGVVTVE